MKFTKKDLFYLSIIFVLVVTFLSYNLRYKLLKTAVGQKIGEVSEELKTERENQLLTSTADFPKPAVTLSDFEFKDLILKEVPVVSQDVSDLEKVTALREWVFLNVPTSDSSLIINNLSNIPPNSIQGRIRIQIFREGLAGAWCGTTAQTLKKVYDLFGYEAYNVNQGDSSEADTHVISIVNINHQGKQLFSVQDAYLNYYLSDLDDNPLSYFKALTLLKARRDKDIKIQWGKLDGRYKKLYLLPKGTKSNSVYKTFDNGNIVELRKFDGYFDLLERFKPLLTKSDYPNDFLYVYLFPFGLYGKDGEKAQLLLNIAQRITEKLAKSDPQENEN